MIIKKRAKKKRKTFEFIKAFVTSIISYDVRRKAIKKAK